MLEDMQRPPKVSVAEWLLVAALALCCVPAFGETFALQPVDAAALKPLGQKGSTRITEAQLKLVDGLTIRTRRDWPLSVVDDGVKLCRKLGKQYTILVIGGDVPDPTKESHLASVEGLIKTYAAKYAGDPLCWGVHVTGCSKWISATKGHSEELFWGRPMPPKVLAANKRLITAWAAAFPKQRIILAGSANDPAAMRELIKHGVKVAPGRFVYKINSLSPKTPVTGWAGTGLIVEAAKAGGDYGFEMLQPSNHPNFSGTWAQMLAKKAGLEKRAGEPAVYWAIYKIDIAKAGAK
jgi:hypothetical protein